jgi:hypothetical protein
VYDTAAVGSTRTSGNSSQEDLPQETSGDSSEDSHSHSYSKPSGDQTQQQGVVVAPVAAGTKFEEIYTMPVATGGKYGWGWPSLDTGIVTSTVHPPEHSPKVTTNQDGEPALTKSIQAVNTSESDYAPLAEDMLIEKREAATILDSDVSIIERDWSTTLAGFTKTQWQQLKDLRDFTISSKKSMSDLEQTEGGVSRDDPLYEFANLDYAKFVDQLQLVLCKELLKNQELNQTQQALMAILSDGLGTLWLEKRTSGEHAFEVVKQIVNGFDESVKTKWDTEIISAIVNIIYGQTRSYTSNSSVFGHTEDFHQNS